MFTRKFERRVYTALSVLLLSVLPGTTFGAYVLWPSRRESVYQPRQPIPYSHKLHAGELTIDLFILSFAANKRPQATIPLVSTCMKCHEQIQTKDKDGNLTEGMAKLLAHWEKGEPIVWNKVNDLADFVYFDHSRHVSTGVTCQECRGPVETFEYMHRQYGLKMSWCMECHKQTPKEGDPAFERGDATRVPINCTTCHR